MLAARLPVATEFIRAVKKMSKIKARMPFLNSRFLIPVTLFLGIALVHTLLRVRFGITVTDTEFVDVPSVSALGGLATWFTERLGPYFRPIEYLFISAELHTFGVRNYFPMILIHSVMAGIVAVLIYFLVMELTRQKVESQRVRVFVAVAAAVLQSFSFHMIEVTWLILQKSMLTEIYVLTGLLGYLLYLRTGQHRWLIAVWIPGILGPMTRELPGTLALVILVLTVISRKRDFALIVTSIVLSFHLVFPAFLPSFFLRTRLNLDPIIGLGMQRGLLIEGTLPGVLSQLHFDLPWRAALYFSPLAFMSMFVSISLFYFRKKERFAHLAGLVVWLVLLATLTSLYLPDTPVLPVIVPVLFAVAIVIPSLRYGALLPVLFVVPMLPFVFIPVYDVWLRLPALAFIIMALLWIVELPQGIKAVLNSRSWGGLPWFNLGRLKSGKLAVVLIAVLILFQIPNLIMAETTFRNFIGTHEEMARWTSSEMPEGSALVSNLRQTRDIQYLTNNSINAYYLTFSPPRLPPYGPMPGGAGEPFLNLLNRLSLENQTPVYFMVDERFGRDGFPELPQETLEYVKQFRIDFDYPIFDPFYLLLPEPYAEFGGPTDLQFQSKLRAGLFQVNCQATFDIYKYIGSCQSLWLSYDQLPAASGHSPRPWGEYRGFTVTADAQTLYAYPKEAGPYDWKRVRDRRYPALLTGRTLIEVKKAIDNYVGQQKG